MRYTVVLVPDNDTGRYVAYVPVLPGCTTYGDTVDDALAMAHDSITVMLESLVDHDEHVPVEPPGTLVASVTVEAAIPAEAVA